MIAQILKLDSAFTVLSSTFLLEGAKVLEEKASKDIVKKLNNPYVSNMSRNLTIKVNCEFSFVKLTMILQPRRPLCVNETNQLPELLEQVSQLSKLIPLAKEKAQKCNLKIFTAPRESK